MRTPVPRNIQLNSVQRRTSSIQRVPVRFIRRTAIPKAKGMMNPTYPT
jgi:hypothetical protein